MTVSVSSSLATLVVLVLSASYASAAPGEHPFATGVPWPGGVSPLTEFVHHIPTSLDWVYNWTVDSTVIKDKFLGKGYTGYNIYLTSTTWLTEDESNGFLWTHWLQVAVPDDYEQTDLSCIYVTGGSTKTRDQVPSSINEAAVSIAVETNTIAASLLAVPNEPIVFTSDPGNSRTEDAIIAYTWGHYINNTGLVAAWSHGEGKRAATSALDYELLQASVKAMDALQEWSMSMSSSLGITPITRFAIAGASKRGWTTWMVGALDDPRVVAIAPIVAPISNLVPQINEMWESYGSWSFALDDYVNEYLMGWLNTPVFIKLLRIIDPLAYPKAMERIPKFLVMACGDEFFMPDSAKWFWDELPGEKALMMVPNAEHSLAGHAWDVMGSIAQWYRTFKNSTQPRRPEYSWEVSQGGQTIRVQVEDTTNLVGAHVYFSKNHTKRDFRLVTCSNKSVECINLALWGHHKLDPIAPGLYEYTMELPSPNHWTAWFVQLEFSLFADASVTLKYDSRMSIIPEIMPFERCPRDICQCGYSCACTFNCEGTPNPGVTETQPRFF